VLFKAGLPGVVTSGSPAVGTTAATIVGEVDPFGQPTKYHAAYGLARSLWCASGGLAGRPEQVSAVQVLPFSDAAHHVVSTELTGLLEGAAYCAELTATNLWGATKGGQVAFATAVKAKTALTGGTTSSTPSASSGALGSSARQAAPTGSASLIGSSVTVPPGGRQALIRIACKGTATCSGKLTVTIKMTTKKGKRKQGKTVTIGTAGFSVAAGKTATIKLTLNASGRAALSAAHGRLTASLTISKTSPSPSTKQTVTVHLVQQKAKKHKK
jgi:hypothetical protein